MSDYWKKKLDELEKQKAQTTNKKTSKTDYWQNKMTELEKAEDIAPVKKTEIAPVAEEKDDRKWFQKGLFEDGYQFGDITKTILGTGEDVSVNAGTGIVGMGEKIVDALSTLGATMNRGTMMQAAQDEMIFNTLTGKKSDGVLERYQGYQKQVEDETAAFVAKDLYDEEAIAKKIVGTSINSKVLRAMGAEDEESFSVLGEKSDSLVQSAGQLGATAALQAVGVPWWLTTGATTFGAEAESAFNQGADLDEAVLSSAISAGAEILTEKISGGISFGGKTWDDALTKELGRAISNKTVRTLAKLGVDMTLEGGEEILSGVMSAIGQKMTYADEKDFNELFSSEDAFEAFIGGAVLGGGSSVVNTVKANSKGVDAVTGFTETEQKVVDKVYQDAVAEAEKDGKITEKEKRKIYDQVMNDFEKGYISTDTIEETLGGDTYKTYRDTVDSEDALREEFDTLNQMKQGEMTGEQMDRRTELKRQLEDLKTNSQRDQLRQQLSDEVFNLAKDSRLAESYNEQSRRGQSFEADLSKYDTKQQAVVQKAIDSGILNNTNRTHEFVDMIAKISADKGVSFDFTNNEKLKESGYAVDGATVNGYVTKDGITLNIDSSKATRSVAGHEITHILEGTELYTELQNTIFEYAKSKGEYDSRLATLTKLYANVEGADVNAELTADLVGDYLFSDADFVRKLSTEHRNVFEKIFDEIKYLCKVATAGSKEARELERVKKAFEDAYRESGKASGDTKYSLTDNSGKELSKGQQDYFKDSKVRDKNGNLQIMYHGSPEAFTRFDKSKAKGSGYYGRGFYFTNSDSHAKQYGNTYEVYLNITNPIQDGTNDITKEQLRRFVEAVAENEDYGIENYGYGATVDSVTDSVYGKGDFAMLMDINASCVGDMVAAVELFNEVNGTNYNGIIAPTETVAFYPEQIKRTDNTNPTADQDIRYSLTEYTAEEKKAHNDAVREHFGKTYMWAETGYLLLDGTKLDMSGKHDGAPGGYRTVDHRDIVDALGSDYGDGSYSGSLVQFMSEGNIRIIPEMGGINLSVKPTEAQEKALAGYLHLHRGEVVLDIDDANGYTVASVEYPIGTQSSKVLGDIRAYFEDGTKPEYSISADGKTRRYNGDAPMTALRLETGETAPVAETVAENAKAADVAPVQYDIDDAPAAEEDVAAMAEESFAALDDTDAPPEVEAPYYGESKPERANDPFLNRDWDERKTKAFTTDNPDAKPFFQEAAQKLAEDFAYTQPAERGFNAEQYYNSGGEAGFYGWGRKAADDINALMDVYGLSYAQIEEGLDAIIHDTPKVNNKPAKTIEFILNDRMLKGTKMWYSGEEIPPHQGYIEWLNGQQNAAEYAESTAALTDADAPADIAPTADTLTVEDVMPIADAPMAYEAIRPQNATTTAQTAVAEDLTEDDEPQEGRAKQRKWVGTSTESEAVNREILPDDLDQDAIHYQPIPNKVTLGNANSRLNSMGYDAALTYFNSQFVGKKVTLDDIALGERLIQEAIKRGDKKTAGELIQNVSILGTELGQKVQALSIIKKLTPEGQLKMLQKVVERGKAKGDKAYDGVEVTQDMVDDILGAYDKDGSYDQDKLNKAVEDAKQKLANQMKVGFMDKVNAWRYLSMLGNPKTHIRNLFSNVAMKGTTAVKNAIARTIEGGANATVKGAEWLANKATGKEYHFEAPIKNRTKTWKPATDYVKSFAEKTAIEMQDVLRDGGKYSEDASIKAKRKIFKSHLLNWLHDKNGDLLSGEDWRFSKPAFKNAFAECLTANGIKTEEDMLLNPEIVEKARQYATEQSQIATFRQYSWLANKINEIEQKNAATQIAVGAILPFKKTPVNIAKAGLSYSPLGFAKTLTYDVAQVKNGKMEASELVDHLAQNITGTGLALVGYLLAQSGFLSGGGDDDKEGKYDYQLGEQSYAVNIGDKSYSLSWLSPVAMPLFVGANAYEQLVEGKEWNGDVVVQTLSETLDPLSEMSFLSGLDSVLSSYDSGIAKFAGIGEAMVQNYATQFVPTLSSQVATVMDDTKRSTKASRDSGWRAGEETLNKIMFKIPGLRQTLEPSTDIWGNDIKQTENVVGRALETFIAPFAVRENTATEIDAEIKALYSETGDNGLLPAIPDNYINFKDEKYKMSAEDFTAYKKAYGQTAYTMLGELFDISTYQNAGADERADLVNRVYDYARDEAKREYLAKQGVEYTNATEDKVPVYKENAIKGAIYYDVTPDEYSFMEDNPEKYAFFKENGISYADYKNADEDGKRAYTWAYDNPGKYTMSKAVSDDLMTFYKYKSELGDLKADKDEDGESISGSAKEKKMAYIESLDLDYGQKLILHRSMYDGKEDKAKYNQAIVEYLDSRDDISWEDMKTILEELDFTVYDDGRITW